MNNKDTIYQLKQDELKDKREGYGQNMDTTLVIQLSICAFILLFALYNAFIG